MMKICKYLNSKSEYSDDHFEDESEEEHPHGVDHARPRERRLQLVIHTRPLTLVITETQTSD